MKISFVTANLGSGGAERVMSLLANQFVKKGYEVEFVFLKKDIRYYPLQQQITITLANKECESDSLVKKIIWLRTYIKKHRPDVVFAFRISIYLVTLLSLIGIKVPVIASERIDPNYNSTLEKLLQRFLLPLTDWFVVQTHAIKAYYPKFIQKKTSVIFNPVSEKVFDIHNENETLYDNDDDNENYLNTKTTGDKGNGIEKLNSQKEKRIISVGRLHSQKNQKMMIEAFARVADDFPEWKLVIYGEGPERDSIESLISNLKSQIASRILLPGRSEKVIEELNKSEIFAFSSDYEGMSNAVVEAFCVGLPIITTKVSGTEDFINDGENGFLLDIGDNDGMEKAMRMLMNNEVLRKKMGEKNKKEAGQFKIEHIYQQWEDVVNKVVNH